MAQASRLLGVGPFHVLEHVALGDFRFRGEPATLDHSAAFAAWGPVLLELDQVHEVRPPALREALGVRPGTVSHVAWTTDDLGEEREHMAGAGCGLLTTSAGGAVADWFPAERCSGIRWRSINPAHPSWPSGSQSETHGTDPPEHVPHADHPGSRVGERRDRLRDGRFHRLPARVLHRARPAGRAQQPTAGVGQTAITPHALDLAAGPGP
jgi:hypothetical protein